MSRASNRFYVEAIDDGATLHGQLLSTHALSQAWTGTTAIPNWHAEGNHPIVYVDLLSGSSKVSPDSGGKWYYNNDEIEWEDTSDTAVSTDGLFQKVNNYPSSANPTAAIKIIDNLASNGNVNTDSITYTGTYTTGGSAIGFSATTFVRITGVSTQGIFGQIEFVGSNIVTEDNQTISMYPRLYGADGEEITASATGTPFSVTWKMNGTNIGAGQTITIGGTPYYNGKQISEDSITDNCIVECDFSYTVSIDGTSTTLTYKAYANIDDQYDKDQMYIQYVGGSDVSASLKSGQYVTWRIWMGRQDDPTVDTTWQNFYVKLLNSEGNVVTGAVSGINSTISGGTYDGWRQLDVDENDHKATIVVTYDVVHSSNFSNYLTGIVMAVKG